MQRITRFAVIFPFANVNTFASWRSSISLTALISKTFTFAGWVAVTYLIGDQHRFVVSALTLIMALLVAQTRVESGVHSLLEVAIGGLLVNNERRRQRSVLRWFGASL